MTPPRSPQLKIGDTLYRVYDGFGKAEVETVVIGRITPQKAWFAGGSAGLSFQCRTGLPIDEAERCARTRADAIAAFVAQSEESVVEAQATLDRAKRLR